MDSGRRLFLSVAPLWLACSSARADARGRLSLWAGDATAHGHRDGARLQATFFDPRGLARDPRDGAIIVADAANALIRRIDAHGMVQTLAGSPEQRSSVDGPAAQARFVGPDAVAIGPDGAVYIADAFANTVRVLRDGVVRTLAGRAGEPGFADGVGARAQFNHPIGVALRGGELLVADAYNNTLRAIDRAGRVRTIAGTPGVADHRDGAAAQALFNTPVGLAVAADGTVYVSEYFNHDLRRLAADGMVSTLAGAPGRPGDVDGAGGAARLRKPQQICIEPGSGAIIVADGGNRKVRRVDRAGRVSTLAGQGEQADRFAFGALPGALVTPYGVTSGPDGSVLVSSGEALLRIDA